ncbi:hypothetical protein VUJ46_16770 [Chryseobacterium sp. MYb264]|uniref:hypothetical protein n=1 Tax=Chryseobacterium sp. MYb264 TaxID=2745153 RepID=UPI002E13AFB1|nr:hypothetical protein VUJ46_16770 [Chryseobacterium sp. MYb264]
MKANKVSNTKLGEVSKNLIHQKTGQYHRDLSTVSENRTRAILNFLLTLLITKALALILDIFDRHGVLLSTL